MAGRGWAGGLADRSSRPRIVPAQMHGAVQARVLAHPALGAGPIVFALGREGVAPLPSRGRDRSPRLVVGATAQPAAGCQVGAEPVLDTWDQGCA